MLKEAFHLWFVTLHYKSPFEEGGFEEGKQFSGCTISEQEFSMGILFERINYFKPSQQGIYATDTSIFFLTIKGQMPFRKQREPGNIQDE